MTSTELPRSTLGRTGLSVTRLAYGAMELRGVVDLTESQVSELLNGLLDAGINYIDTSPDYGISEERIGRHLAARRDEFFLASKCGCVIEPRPDGPHPHVFTRENVRAGVEQSLERLRTEYLDLVQFHQSPSRATLEEHDAIGELEDMRREGKLRFIGVSGVLPNLAEQIEMGVFDAFQIPYSALDRDHEEMIGVAAAAGAGTIIRGGVARGVADKGSDAVARAHEVVRPLFAERRRKYEQADLDDLLDGMTPMEFMLRFTLSHPDMDTTIVGTSSLAHLRANVAAAAKGPLAPELVAAAKLRLS